MYVCYLKRMRRLSEELNEGLGEAVGRGEQQALPPDVQQVDQLGPQGSQSQHVLPRLPAGRGSHGVGGTHPRVQP